MTQEYQNSYEKYYQTDKYGDPILDKDGEPVPLEQSIMPDQLKVNQIEIDKLLATINPEPQEDTSKGFLDEYDKRMQAQRESAAFTQVTVPITSAKIIPVETCPTLLPPIIRPNPTGVTLPPIDEQAAAVILNNSKPAETLPVFETTSTVADQPTLMEALTKTRAIQQAQIQESQPITEVKFATKQNPGFLVVDSSTVLQAITEIRDNSQIPTFEIPKEYTPRFDDSEAIKLFTARNAAFAAAGLSVIAGAFVLLKPSVDNKPSKKTYRPQSIKEVMDKANITVNTGEGIYSKGGLFTPAVMDLLEALGSGEARGEGFEKYDSGNHAGNKIDAFKSTDTCPKFNKDVDVKKEYQFSFKPKKGTIERVIKMGYNTGYYQMFVDCRKRLNQNPKYSGDIKVANAGLKLIGFDAEITSFHPFHQDLMAAGTIAILINSYNQKNPGDKINPNISIALKNPKNFDKIIKIISAHWMSVPGAYDTMIKNNGKKKGSAIWKENTEANRDTWMKIAKGQKNFFKNK